MPTGQTAEIDVSGVSLVTAPGGQPITLGSFSGVQILVLLRHRHCLPCQQHLAQVHQGRDDPRAGLILVGFSPPQQLAAQARQLSWPGQILADQQRVLYQRLGIGRAPLWRTYSPGTLTTYAAALLRGQRLARPVEDIRQLGADAIMVDGVVRQLWRPRTPSDRPAAREVIAAASTWLARHSP